MLNYPDHEQCKHLQFWLANCFLLQLRQNHLITTLVYSEYFIIGKRLCSENSLDFYTPSDFLAEALYSLFSYLKSIVPKFG